MSSRFAPFPFYHSDSSKLMGPNPILLGLFIIVMWHWHGIKKYNKNFYFMNLNCWIIFHVWLMRKNVGKIHWYEKGKKENKKMGKHFTNFYKSRDILEDCANFKDIKIKDFTANFKILGTKLKNETNFENRKCCLPLYS